MLSIKRAMLCSLICVFGVGTACGQTRPKAEKVEQAKPKFEVKAPEFSTGKEAERLLKDIERQREIRNKFNEEDMKCDNLINNRKMKEAETVCKAALQLAEQLEADSKYERMAAYESVGHAMLGQQRYTEALDYYSHAFDLGQTRYTQEDASLGRLYSNVAIAQHMLGNLDEARELYRKAEQIYHHAYTTFVVTNTAEGLAEQKQRYLNSLKLILKHHRIAAEDAGAASEIDEIDKLVKSLP